MYSRCFYKPHKDWFCIQNKENNLFLKIGYPNITEDCIIEDCTLYETEELAKKYIQYLSSDFYKIARLRIYFPFSERKPAQIRRIMSPQSKLQ
jgi:hypothetical protein